MHLVEILTDQKNMTHGSHAPSLRVNPENRATQPAAQRLNWPRAKAGVSIAEIQDIQTAIHNANFRAPEPLRSGVLTFAPLFKEVTH